MDYKKRLGELIDAKKDDFIKMNDEIWGFAEPRFQEYKSSALQAAYMEKQGFKVSVGHAGEETALIAEYGSGKPVIAFLGEFDSLPGLSQEADSTSHTPISGCGDGHGCGHHALGTASLAATVALKEYMAENNIKGTIRYYGCPAEENAGGKAYLVRDGLFNDCDIALTWHPGWMNAVTPSGSLANFRVFYTFTGRSAHAAGAPHLGRSALDALELMNVGVNYMREHMIDEARVHYAVTDTGGTAPNVVQAKSQVLYAMRAPTVVQVKELYERIAKIAKGAAMMTETEVDIKQVAAYSNYRANDIINEKLGVHMKELLPIGYTDEEISYAKGFQEVSSDLDKQALKGAAERIVGKKQAAEVLKSPLFDFLVENPAKPTGSTDVGDVSWVVPTGQFSAVTCAAGTAGHSWQFTGQGKSSINHKGVLFAANVLARTAFDFLTDDSLIKSAKEAYIEDLAGETYPNPLPADAKPAIW